MRRNLNYEPRNIYFYLNLSQTLIYFRSINFNINFQGVFYPIKFHLKSISYHTQWGKYFYKWFYILNIPTEDLVPNAGICKVNR